MLSRKNTQALTRKYQDRQQRFGLRKLTVGFVSVLLALAFMGTAARADDGSVASSDQATSQLTKLPQTQLLNYQLLKQHLLQLLHQPTTLIFR